MNCLGHIRILPDESRLEQTAAEHCRKTAEYAGECLRGIGLAAPGYLAGLLHDFGKFQSTYQEYLEKAAAGEPVKRGSVIHTFQGCRMLLERYHEETPDRYEDITAELLAFAVGAHHGLFDCVDERRRSGFFHRMTAEGISYKEAVTNFTGQCADETEIRELFDRANGELTVVYDRLAAMTEKAEVKAAKTESAADGGSGTGDGETGADDRELLFYLSFLARLILSAVIEGDRRDTAEFMTDAVFPDYGEDMREFWNRRLAYLKRKLGGLSNPSRIGQARQAISDQCERFAQNPCGVYRFHVPTGAGKTLSGLRFAMAHAERWNKKRIIFTAPLLTILDQNAKVIHEFIGDDSVILEHHSNVIHTEENAETLDEKELLTENWGAPVIITTLVQLLHTLFDGKTSSVRRFQALCDSVIVIDEVQTVPNRLLSLFNLAVNFLSEICHATVVLCSATQPCLEQAVHPLRNTPQEIIPYQKELWSAFERTRLVDAGGCRLEEIPDFVRERAQETDSLLIVCNKKQEAEFLFRQLSGEEFLCFHLSAAMCMQHRRNVLEDMERALTDSRSGDKKVICVSTQVVEAGVDISFGCVIRLTAGMDSVIQAAGRCNRNGERKGLASVYLLGCMDESLGMLREIQEAKTATTALLTAYKENAARFGDRLSSDEAIGYFYRKLYREMSENYQDTAVPNETYTLFSLLSDNEAFADEDCECCGSYCLNQAFALAGGQFTVFDENTEDVVVPYGEGQRLIAELCSHPDDLSFLKDWKERAKPYTVSLYQYQKRQLGSDGLSMVSGVLVLQPGCYDDRTGLVTEQKRLEFMEV